MILMITKTAHDVDQIDELLGEPQNPTTWLGLSTRSTLKTTLQTEKNEPI